MGRRCPLGGYVLYLDCLECDEKACKGGGSLGNDIKTPYTKEKNRVAGRRGYCGWKRENVDVISPKEYGAYKAGRKGAKRCGK